jgi:DNA polymerase IIIc chi subunit
MEDSDKLMNLVQKMSKAQLRQVTRFAEFILLEDEPDDLNDRSDVRTRYTTFKESLRVDPAAIDAWAKSSGQK